MIGVLVIVAAFVIVGLVDLAWQAAKTIHLGARHRRQRAARRTESADAGVRRQFLPTWFEDVTDTRPYEFCTDEALATVFEAETPPTLRVVRG